MLPDYLGDGVYADFDGYGITLKANDHENPTDTIYLEPEVLAALNRYAERVTRGAPARPHSNRRWLRARRHHRILE